MGWGESEMGEYNYWGGNKDYIDLMRNSGNTVFELSVGPVSSNWDRAIEAYYQLKGGQVDYGKKHSETYGIIQKPENKNWEGLYPKWNSNNPIHIIGHSLGGQTARMLQFMLENEIFIDSSSSLVEESDLL